ncbi:MAG: bifunctional 4-hydroxy-2-oxoglutarate aldolase/2-dehydro-3-deoxy-phosphogluconate aldolase [Cyanobacteria bacterium P01_A01_bin.45]
MSLSWLEIVKKHQAIAVIRADEIETARNMALAVAEGGIKLIEITWNSDQPGKLISQLRVELPDCIIGTGTLLNQEHMKNAIASGAEFLFTPHVDPSMIQIAKNNQIPVIPGALTPTEIVTAWHGGATCVKVFPVKSVGGAEYIKSLKAPLGHIPLIPTGGISYTSALEFLKAGAIAVGLSSDLFPKSLVESKNWCAISHRATKLIKEIQKEIQIN